MQTRHRIIIGDAGQMTDLGDHSIDLVITSPPYPMIRMWDDIFCAADPAVKKHLSSRDGDAAFECMHALLDKTWREVGRVTKPGGLVCINVGDATRSIGGRFRLFGNHSRIISTFRNLGFDQLPLIIWRKTTNAPNKFMGSGMYPPGAYVTLEHEYVLIFRRGGLREFHSDEQKQNRRQSAYFWEERNAWFSDVWFNLVGTRQTTNSDKGRARSAAFPFELPYRLVHMFSVKGDVVLDPFLGTGTTMLAAMAGARNSIGFEIDSSLKQVMLDRIAGLPDLADRTLRERLQRHEAFVRERFDQGKTIKYRTLLNQFPVITRQECDLRFERVDQVHFTGNDEIKIAYQQFQQMPARLISEEESGPEAPENKSRQQGPRQLEMF